MLENNMKAVLIDKACEASDLRIKEIPIPSVKPGWVLIKVMAFGINHSEVLMRKFEIERPYINSPIVPGIECVGYVEDGSDSRFRKGEKVMAMMGGMGRSFNGSYAEYALLPESHVFAVRSDPDWEELAALPETFYTAFSSLDTSLQLSRGELLLVRGGTSTVGLAAIQLGKALGAKVVATTRNPLREELLRSAGADSIILEGDDFRRRFLESFPAGADKVLELIGAATLRESLAITRIHGIVCHTGLLGNVYALKDFDPIKEIPSGVYLTGFYSNRPLQRDIDRMMDIIGKNAIHPFIAARYRLDKISDAHTLAETRGVSGKIVVTV